MPIVKARSGTWCDYCKNRFGTKISLGQQPAVVSIISEVRKKGTVRSYCNDCMLQITHWDCMCKDYRNCPNRFTLMMQFTYGKETQGELDV